MKKILLALVAVTLGMVSCKKDEEVKPAVKTEIVAKGEKQDIASWD